jgi:hypothetical protein
MLLQCLVQNILMGTPDLRGQAISISQADVRSCGNVRVNRDPNRSGGSGCKIMSGALKGMVITAEHLLNPGISANGINKDGVALYNPQNDTYTTNVSLPRPSKGEELSLTGFSKTQGQITLTGNYIGDDEHPFAHGKPLVKVNSSRKVDHALLNGMSGGVWKGRDGNALVQGFYPLEGDPNRGKNISGTYSQGTGKPQNYQPYYWK